MHSNKKVQLVQEKNDGQSSGRRENGVQEKSDRQSLSRQNDDEQPMTPVGNYNTNCADQSIGQIDNEKKIAKGNRGDNKRKKGKAKSSQPWEQDHLTFQVNFS
ncbi:unnamed protein product [Rhizophagus irregularis]|nr:unnamed protein product [Rhizophagus irregularis]